jgi:hypothetical protein
MSNLESITQSTVQSSAGRRAIPEAFWSPLAGALLTLLPGLLGMALGLPLLFASLGPTAYLQVAQPQQPTSRFHNVVFGHFLGFALGIVAVFLLGAASDPSIFQAQKLTPARLEASVLSMAATLLISAPLKVGFHPPAAATTLLVTLGGFKPTWSEARTVAMGVFVVAIVGELLRRLRLAQPGQK